MNRRAIQIVSCIAFVATLTVAVFGFSVMGAAGNMVMGCFGAAPGGSCSALGAIQHFESHMSAFQKITNVLVGSAFSVLALLFLAVLALAGIDIGAAAVRRYIVRRFYDPIAVCFARFGDWLALHEKRDPSFGFAVNR